MAKRIVTISIDLDNPDYTALMRFMRKLSREHITERCPGCGNMRALEIDPCYNCADLDLQHELAAAEK